MFNKLCVALAILIFANPVLAAQQKQAGGLLAELSITPSDPPNAGKLSILGFDFRGPNGEDVTHVDGYVDIALGERRLVNDYYIHTHNDDLSMLYTFPEQGTYLVSVSIEPSGHYRGWEFEAGKAEFKVTVSGASVSGNAVNGGIGTAQILMGAGVIVVLGALAINFRKKN